MKITVFVLVLLLFLLTVLYPVGVLITAGSGCTFELISVPGFSIAIALLSVCVAILNIFLKTAIEHTTIHVVLAVITPLSFLNAALYVFECNTPLVIVCSLISVVCCLILSVKYGKPLVLKIISVGLSVFMMIPFVYFCMIIQIFGDLAHNTVVQTVESPSGKYYTRLIDSDQGALGGNTLVEVYEKSQFDVFFFKIQKEPRRVYQGPWGVYKHMNIYWKDDRCLIINSSEYLIE